MICVYRAGPEVRRGSLMRHAMGFDTRSVRAPHDADDGRHDGAADVVQGQGPRWPGLLQFRVFDHART
eukprot:7377777-Prymnesium_polylepis.1